MTTATEAKPPGERPRTLFHGSEVEPGPPRVPPGATLARVHNIAANVEVVRAVPSAEVFLRRGGLA